MESGVIGLLGDVVSNHGCLGVLECLLLVGLLLLVEVQVARDDLMINITQVGCPEQEHSKRRAGVVNDRLVAGYLDLGTLLVGRVEPCGELDQVFAFGSADTVEVV